MERNLTQADELVLALAEIEERLKGKRFASVAELVVAVYRADRGTWGMAGFEGLYPCSNRAIAMLSSKNGPIRRGFIVRPVPGCALVELTKAGRHRAKELRQRKAVT